MKKSCCLCLLLCLGAGNFLAGPLSLTTHFGRLTNLERTSEAQKFVSEDEALKQGLTAPGGDVPAELLLETSPDDDQVFVILDAAVFPDRTLSPLDYLLVVDGRDCKCLGMAERRSGYFDFRYLLVTGPAEVKLIFSCSASARLAALKSALEVPLPTITGLVLQEPEPVPEPAPEPAPAAEAGTADVAEGQPAAEPAAAQDAAPESENAANAAAEDKTDK